MGRHSDYSIKEDKEKISFEEAYAKLGKDVMTPSDYVPLVEKYLGLPVDEKTIRKRVQEICNRSQGLLSVRDFKSGSKNSYRFDPSYNELLLALIATECFDKRKNDSRVSTRAAIYNQLLQNIVRLPKETQETIKKHPAWLNTKLECKLMDRIAYELAANIAVLSSATTVLRYHLMYQFIGRLVRFRIEAQQEDALLSIDRIIDSRSIGYRDTKKMEARQYACEAEKLEDFLISLIAIQKQGDEFQYVSSDEILSSLGIQLARKVFRLEVPAELEKEFEKLEGQLYSEARYAEIKNGLKKILNLDDDKEKTLYSQLVRVMEIEYLKPNVSPEDYDRMIRFTEDAVAAKKEEMLRELNEELEKRKRRNKMDHDLEK